MCIAFASGFHLEYSFPDNVDVIVLADDIHVSQAAADLAIALAASYETTRAWHD
jgi:hypothetical protein